MSRLLGPDNTRPPTTRRSHRQCAKCLTRLIDCRGDPRRVDRFKHLFCIKPGHTHVCNSCSQQLIAGLDTSAPPPLRVQLALANERLSATEAELAAAKAELAALGDWQQRGLVETYDTGKYGQGVRAVRSIPLNDKYVLAALIHGKQVTDEEYSTLDDVDYIIDLGLEDKASVWVDLIDEWTGLINHSPPARANMKFFGLTLVQIRPIRKGEALTVDYGWQYWYQKCYREDEATYNQLKPTDESTVEMRTLKALQLAYQILWLEAFQALHKRTVDWSVFMRRDGRFDKAMMAEVQLLWSDRPVAVTISQLVWPSIEVPAQLLYARYSPPWSMMVILQLEAETLFHKGQFELWVLKKPSWVKDIMSHPWLYG